MFVGRLCEDATAASGIAREAGPFPLDLEPAAMRRRMVVEPAECGAPEVVEGFVWDLAAVREGVGDAARVVSTEGYCLLQNMGRAAEVMIRDV